MASFCTGWYAPDIIRHSRRWFYSWYYTFIIAFLLGVHEGIANGDNAEDVVNAGHAT
jgi:hypothetical protein